MRSVYCILQSLLLIYPLGVLLFLLTLLGLNHLATISCYHPLLSTMYTSVNEVFFSNEAFSTNQLFSLNKFISYHEFFSCK